MTEGFNGVADIREIVGDNMIHFGTCPPVTAEPPAAEGLMLAAGLRASRPDPDFTYGYCPWDSLQYFRRQDVLPQVCVYGLRDVTVIGPWFQSGALLVQNGIRLKCDDLALNPEDAPSVARFTEDTAERKAGARVLRQIDEPVILLATNGHQIFGHWMVDFLPKLHLLSLAGISLKSVRILLPANMGPFGRDLLRALDIGDEQILLHDPEKETLRCRTLIVPTMLRRAGRCHPIFADAIATLNEMIDRTGAVPASPLRRIYIARDPRFGRRLLGGEQAETIATQHDFTAIRPEQLPITSQIALFRGAREILGSYGSALHASIFCRPGVKIAAIHGQLPHAFDALQSGIGERLGQPAGYIFGQSLPDDPESIGFEETAFRTCLAEQFSHPNFLKPVPPKPDMTKSLVNIALNRPATQSSISVWSAETTPEREAERGVNGIVDAKNWFQTKLEDQPWWQVDLGAQFTLYSIRIFNRTGTTDVMARVAALGIALSTDGITWRKIMGPADHGIFGGADGDPLIWRAADFRDPETGRQGDEITARLVKVFLESKDLLSLGQVEVYGTPASTSTSSEPRQTGPLSGLLPDDVF